MLPANAPVRLLFQRKIGFAYLTLVVLLLCLPRINHPIAAQEPDATLVERIDDHITGYMEDEDDWRRLSVRDRVQWACMCVPELRVHDVFKWSTTIGRSLARIMQRSEQYAKEALKG